METFTYSPPTIPKSYHCSKCKASGVRLWRQYNTFADCIKLLCVDCAVKDQGKDGEQYIDGQSYQIGWLVAAVPVETGHTYWGYTSVPDAGVEWWDALPVRITDGTMPPLTGIRKLLANPAIAKLIRKFFRC